LVMRVGGRPDPRPQRGGAGSETGLPSRTASSEPSSRPRINVCVRRGHGQEINVQQRQPVVQITTVRTNAKSYRQVERFTEPRNGRRYRLKVGEFAFKPVPVCYVQPELSLRPHLGRRLRAVRRSGKRVERRCTANRWWGKRVLVKRGVVGYASRVVGGMPSQPNPAAISNRHQNGRQRVSGGLPSAPRLP